MKSIAIIEAPSILGLRPTGVEHLPDALVSAGLLAWLHARHAGRVNAPMYSSARDPETGFLNPQSVADYSHRLAQRVGEVLDQGDFALVLGGDCSILLGAMLALNERSRHGLLFLDGHMDFYDQQSNVNGEVASSELALVTGRGPALLTTYDGRCPLVRDEDVVAFGFRDEWEAQSYGSPPLAEKIKAIGLEEVRRMGLGPAHEKRSHTSRNKTHATSGFTSMPMCSTTPSCQRWTTGCLVALAGSRLNTFSVLHLLIRERLAWRSRFLIRASTSMGKF